MEDAGDRGDDHVDDCAQRHHACVCGHVEYLLVEQGPHRQQPYDVRFLGLRLKR